MYPLKIKQITTMSKLLKTLLAILLTTMCCNINATLSTTNLSDNDYVSEWGRLKLVGNQLCSESGEPIQLKGFASFHLLYENGYKALTDDAFDLMKRNGANVIRLTFPAQKTIPDNYLTLAEQFINMASERGMYVIVDWDCMSYEVDIKTYKEAAFAFFQRIPGYKKKNIIYEICGEPHNTWSEIKTYADYIMNYINKYDPGAVVIVGTPNWSHDIMEPYKDPINESKYNLNIMYAYGYYTDNYARSVNDVSELNVALASLPVFITCMSQGHYDTYSSVYENLPYEKEVDNFLAMLNKGNCGKQLVSWCNWYWGDKNEMEGSIYSYKSLELRPSGQYIIDRMNGTVPIGTLPASTPYRTQTIPYGNEDWGVLNIGWYDEGGEGTAYHDRNSTFFLIKTDTNGDTYTDYTTPEETGKEMDYRSKFRIQEGVDLSNCSGLTGTNNDGYMYTTNNLYDIGYNEEYEWHNYTINVKKAGYYTVQAMTNPQGDDMIGMQIVNSTKPGQNGNIIRNWYNRNTDISTDAELSPWTSVQMSASGISDPDNNWKNYNWMPLGSTEYEKKAFTVLFKYPGKQTLQIISLKGGNKHSNILFTLKSTEIPEHEYKLCDDPKTAKADAAMGYMIGDANNDNSISMADANLVVNYFLATEKNTINGINVLNADANCDDNISMADANQIVNMFLQNDN